MDDGTEAEALSDWDDYGYEDDETEEEFLPAPSRSRSPRSTAGDREQPDRWRCVVVGCNPRLDVDSAGEHFRATGHRVAKWPVRSAEGKRRAAERNRTGYYDRYNVGAKSARVRGIR